MASTNLAYRPFPFLINNFTTWKQRGYDIYGSTENDRLFAGEIYAGLSGKLPLGDRHGVILYNGLSQKDAILAAACNESDESLHVFSDKFSSNTLVYLPSLESVSVMKQQFVEEKMVASSGPDKGVIFSFSVEVGADMKREAFEWRKIYKSSDSIVENGGYKLVRIGSGQESRGEPGSSSAAAQVHSHLHPEHVRAEGSPGNSDVEAETVALLEWGKNSLLKKRSWTVGHGFSIQLTGSGKMGLFGERWALMVVITAMRIYLLRITARTKHGVIKMAESRHAKAAKKAA